MVPRHPARTRSAALLAAWAGSIAFAAMVPVAASLTPVEEMRDYMKNIQANLTNARMKIRHGVGSAGGPRVGELGPAPKKFPRAVENCCTRNVEIIDARLRSIRAVLRELESRAERDDDPQAAAVVAHLGKAHADLRKQFEEFAAAGAPQHATMVLKRVDAAFNHMREVIAEYEACCAKPAEAAPAGKDGKKIKKKKGKKKKKPKDA